MVHVAVEEGEFAGWEATARADFPARLLADLQSGKVDRLITALDEIITDHNFPDSEDRIAATMSEVDPYPGLLEVGGRVLDAIGKLPNR
jgi:hypothetical protein